MMKHLSGIAWIMNCMDWILHIGMCTDCAINPGQPVILVHSMLVLAVTCYQDKYFMGVMHPSSQQA